MKNHILDMLIEYSKFDNLRFHMPGHKGCEDVFFDFFKYDITELSFSGNLLDSSGVIGLAEKDISSILKSKRSFLLTDGSTSGIYSMVYAVKDIGKKLIINRNAHKSVFSACKLFNIEPIVLEGRIEGGVFQPPSPESVERAFDETDICGVLLTSPDYYGNVIDYKRIKKLTESRSVPMLIDGAHGSHLAFTNEELYAGRYADIWVDGAHKTLPTLTQGAILNVGNEKYLPLVEESVNLFRTTSPSYLIMASIEYGVKKLAGLKKEVYLKQKAEIERLIENLKKINVEAYKNQDEYKLCLDLIKTKRSADEVATVLEKDNIYVEFSDERYLNFYLSPMTKIEEISLIYDKIKGSLGVLSEHEIEDFSCKIESDSHVEYLKAINGECLLLSLEDSVGKTSADNVGLYPPCSPLIIAGEKISRSSVNLLKKGKSVFGFTDGKIKVLKDTE